MIKKLKTLLSYTAMLFILILYTFFLDGKSGTVMTAFFIFTPIISIVLTIFAGKGVNAEIICTDCNIRKNHEISYTLKFTKKSFLPAPFILVKTAESPHFVQSRENIIKVSMPIKKEIYVEKKIYAHYSGSACISVENAEIYDYLNIFSFRLRNISCYEEIMIAPQVHELSSAGTIFRKVSDTVLIDENEDESTAESPFSMASFPGYEHREYRAGDPLKRINWKLSAKKNKLMVRLDENMPSVRPSVVLNLSECSEDTAGNIALKEIITEGCLSFMDFCIRQGIECNFYYYENGTWNQHNIMSEEDLGVIALKIPSLPDYAGIPLPENAFSSGKSSLTYVIFIQRYTDRLSESIYSAEQSGNNIMAVVSQKTVPADNLWFIDSSYEIKELSRE
jgi:hypothetical protein